MSIVVTGVLETLDMPETGEVRLDLKLREDDRYALAPGQERLGCIVHAKRRDVMDSVLLRLRVGQPVEVSGYWTARDEAGGTRYYINDTTCVDPFVE